MRKRGVKTMRPAMSEPEYAALFASTGRDDLLRLCRAAGFSAGRLKTNAALIHLLWIKIGRQRAEDAERELWNEIEEDSGHDE